MISLRAAFPSEVRGRPARDQAARLLRYAVVAPSLGLGLASCGAASAPRPMDTVQQEASVIHPCFDGEAAARLDPVTLEYVTSPAGSQHIEYRNAIEVGGPRLAARVRADMAPVLAGTDGPRLSIVQELTFSLPTLAAQSARMTTVSDDHGEHVAWDVVVDGGRVRGQAMAPPDGHTIPVDAALEDAVLLPAGARALLPFFRLDRCANVTLRSLHPRGGPYDVRLEVGERRVVEVPAGRFEAIEVVVGDYSEPLTYLVRAVPPHFILRYEIPGVGGVVELAGITPAR
mgnify:CR=1 FL=1